MKTRFFFLSFFIIFSTIIKADTIFIRPKNFILNTCSDLALQTISPLRKGNAIKALCTVGVCAALIPLDDYMNKKLIAHQPGDMIYKQSIHQISQLGGRYAYIGLGTLAAYSLIWKKPQTFHYTMLTARAVITTAIWIRIIKTLTGRERPFYAAGSPNLSGRWNGPAGAFRQFSERGKYDAFPSGHTGTAFAMAGVIALAGADKPWIPPLCYGTAALVGFSRLSKNEHWLSDVVLGAVIGLACGRQVFLNETQYRKSIFKKRNGLQSLNFHFGIYPLL